MHTQSAPFSAVVAGSRLSVLTVLLLLFSSCGGGSSHSMEPPTPSQFALTKLSQDIFTNTTSEHETEVEADTFSHGSTIVSAFQVGRRHNGGASDIGFATSTDNGTTWTSAFLPDVTMFQAGGPSDAASDPSVAYDAAHNVWLIGFLTITGPADAALVSRSTDGLNWSSPITVSTNPNVDKTWAVCDNNATSPFFGHCYLQWEDIVAGTVFVNTSVDGGLTWGPDTHTTTLGTGVGFQSVVLPSGVAVLPLISFDNTNILSLTSSDGGATWNDPIVISPLISHTEAGELRSGGLTADIDNTGKVIAVWPDCRFRTGCSANDLVMSTSTDGMNWTNPARIPIDPLTSTVDHFLPGMGIDPATGGASAHITVIYYDYSQSTCTTSNCALNLGFVSSQDGGNTWSAGQNLAGPMSLAWLPQTGLGYMVGDYLSVSYVNGQPFSVFAVAQANSGTVFSEAMYTTTKALVPSRGSAYYSAKGEKPVPHAKSDHLPVPHRGEREEAPPTQRAIARHSAKSLPSGARR